MALMPRDNVKNLFPVGADPQWRHGRGVAEAAREARQTARPQVLRAGDAQRQRPEIPPQLARVMRSELPALVEGVTREVRRAIPAYARPENDTCSQATRQAVEQFVTHFVDLIEDPCVPREKLHETCRWLGDAEANEGRTLDDLHAAYRVGARVGWQWITHVGQRHSLSSAVISRLAEMLFGYADELARLSFQGHREAGAKFRGTQGEFRRQLMRLVLEQPPVPADTITELARATGWPVPNEVAMVAVEVTPRTGREPTSSLGPDTLADLRLPLPHLLLPAPVEEHRGLLVAAKLGGVRIAIGPAMPLDGAASSLQWARSALRLVSEGVLPDVPVTFCADHLTTLWLLAEEELVTQLGKHQLAPLDEFPSKARRRLECTLLSWLETKGNIREAAAQLDVHPQTVRYRLRQLEEAFGEQWHDPEARFAMEAALRASRLRWMAHDG
ncbi:MAG: helix-turn-helix domain-containing protein [Umezawaea sp.]